MLRKLNIFLVLLAVVFLGVGVVHAEVSSGFSIRMCLNSEQLLPPQDADFPPEGWHCKPVQENSVGYLQEDVRKVQHSDATAILTAIPTETLTPSVTETSTPEPTATLEPVPTENPTEVPACSDGKDNDRDGQTDWPEDLTCSSANDTSEYGGGSDDD